jgi:putative inorganic carbon (HCO3(-)) transporter
VVLLLSTPWLLFPGRFPLLTAAALVALVAVWLAHGLKTGRLFPRTPLNLALLLWAVMLLVGTLASADPDLTLPKLTGLLLGLALLRYLALVVDGPEPRGRVLLAFLTLGAGLMALGVLTVDWTVKAPALEAVVSRLPAPLLRLPGTAAEGAHANQLAGSLLLLIPLAAAAGIGSYLSRPVRVAALGLAGAGLLLLVLTQSRAGWIGGAAGGVTLVGLLLWLRVGRTGRFRLILLGGTLTVAAIALALQVDPQQWRALLDEPDLTAAVGTLDTVGFRLEVWRWGAAAVGDFPFTGVGLGAFRRVALRLYPLNVPAGYDIAHAHNIFLQVGLDLGLPGVVAYVTLLLVAAQRLWRALVVPRARPLAYGCLIALVAFHVYGLGDALAPGAKPALLFWFILGLAVTLPGQAASPQRRE